VHQQPLGAVDEHGRRGNFSLDRDKESHSNEKWIPQGDDERREQLDQLQWEILKHEQKLFEEDNQPKSQRLLESIQEPTTLCNEPQWKSRLHASQELQCEWEKLSKLLQDDHGGVIPFGGGRKFPLKNCSSSYKWRIHSNV
jgi:hypothetical protein